MVKEQTQYGNVPKHKLPVRNWSWRAVVGRRPGAAGDREKECVASFPENSGVSGKLGGL